MIPPTIVPIPCGKNVGGCVCGVRTFPACPDVYRCDQCRTVGEQLIDAAYNMCEGGWVSALAWNLTIACLLGHAYRLGAHDMATPVLTLKPKLSPEEEIAFQKRIDKLDCSRYPPIFIESTPPTCDDGRIWCGAV